MTRFLAPLVDVFLLLLVFLIIEAEFDLPDQSQLQLPRASQDTETTASDGASVRIELLPDRRVTVDGSELELDSDDFRQAVSGRTVVLALAAERKIGMLTLVWDACRSAGCASVRLLVDAAGK